MFFFVAYKKFCLIKTRVFNQAVGGGYSALNVDTIDICCVEPDVRCKKVFGLVIGSRK